MCTKVNRAKIKHTNCGITLARKGCWRSPGLPLLPQSRATPKTGPDCLATSDFYMKGSYIFLTLSLDRFQVSYLCLHSQHVVVTILFCCFLSFFFFNIFLKLSVVLARALFTCTARCLLTCTLCRFVFPSWELGCLYWNCELKKRAIPHKSYHLNNWPPWWVSLNGTSFLSLFKYLVCSCLKGGTAWTKMDVKVKAQRICRLKLLWFFSFLIEHPLKTGSICLQWVILFSAQRVNSSCLSLKLNFFLFAPVFYFNTEYAESILLLRGSFIPSWKPGAMLSCNTFLKCPFGTLQPVEVQTTCCFIYLCELIILYTKRPTHIF